MQRIRKTQMKWITSLQNTVYLKLISAEIESLRTLISKKKISRKSYQGITLRESVISSRFHRGNSSKTSQKLESLNTIHTYIHICMCIYFASECGK